MENFHFYNKVYLEAILTNIEFSHESHDKQYNKAIAVLSNGSCAPIKFPASIEQNENEELCFFGNIRLFNKKIYVYTNFQPIAEEEKRFCGYTEIYGRVTKVDKKFDSYIIDCGNNAFVPLKSKRNFEVDDVINISGKFIQRQFKKKDSKQIFTTYEVVESL